MKLQSKNSPPRELAAEDFVVPLRQLLWALLGVIAMWLNVDLPDAMGNGTFMNMAVSGLAVYLASLLYRYINDNRGADDSESKAKD